MGATGEEGGTVNTVARLKCWTCGHVALAHADAPAAPTVCGHCRALMTVLIEGAVTRALEAARADGFVGEVVEVRSVGDERHELHLVTCQFEDGTSTYVVAADTHEGGGRPTMLALSDAVHVLQNLTAAERWELSAREPV